MMVSENLYNDVLISTEQKSLPNILDCPNFTPKEAIFAPEMSKVDVGISDSSTLFSQSQNDVFRDTTNDINRNEKVTNDNSKLTNTPKEDLDFISSDIELNVEESESDEKSRSNTVLKKTVSQNTATNKLPVHKDIESIESLDNDLSNTAHLVGKNFLQDDFDSLDDLGDVNSPLGNTSADLTLKNDVDESKCDSNASNVDNGKQPNSFKSCEESQACESDTNATPQTSLVSSVNMSGKSTNESERKLIEGCDVKEESPVNCDSDAQLTKDVADASDQSTNEVTLMLTEKVDELRDETVVDRKQKDFTADPSIKLFEPLTNPTEKNQVESKNAETDILERSWNHSSLPVQEAQIEPNSIAHNQEDEVPSKQNDDNIKEIIEPQTEIKEEISSALCTRTEKLQNMEMPNAQIASSETLNEPENIDNLNRNSSSIPEAPSLSKENTDLREIKISEANESLPLQTDHIEDTPSVEPSTKESSNDIPPADEVEKYSENQDIIPPNDNTEVPPNQEDNLSSTPTVNLSEGETTAPEIIDSLDKPSSPAPPCATIDIPQKCTAVSSPSPPSPGVNVEASPPRVESPLSCQDNDLNVEPKSVECTELFIDLVEPDGDDFDEPMEVDSFLTINDAISNVIREQIANDENAQVSSNLRERANQLFENTAKEISSCDTVTEASGKDTGKDYHQYDSAEVTCLDDAVVIAAIETSHPEIILKRHDTSSLENRKRKIATFDTSDSLEKRSKSGTEYQNITITDARKKTIVNTARKHTSSTNVSKTIKEIESKITEDKAECSKADDSSKEPGEVTLIPQTFDVIDFVVNAQSVGDSVQLGHCNVAVPPVPDNTPKIDLKLDAISKDNLKSIFSTLKTKLTRRQLEEIVLLKCCEVMASSSEISELRKQMDEMQQAEFFRKQKIMNLEKQISQLKAVCQKYLEQARESRSERLITPIKITRSVGLQVAIGSTPHVAAELSPSNDRGEERLKKLLTSSSTGKKNPPAENRQSSPAPRSHSNNSTPANFIGKKTELKVLNNNYSKMNGRVNSPLNNSPTPSTPPLPNVNRSDGALVKKVDKTVDPNNTVIDLTDKDDRNEIEVKGAAKTFLGGVNGTVLAYVPVAMNRDQNRQVLQPGTPILLNGQLMTVKSKTYSPLGGNNKHPAPVPDTPPVINRPGMKPLPPRPLLKISKNTTGIMLSWNMPTSVSYSTVSKYQLYAYQELDVAPSTELWKEVGEVDALPLPMACTLTQFQEGHRYHFIIRAVDIHGRIAPFSYIESILL